MSGFVVLQLLCVLLAAFINPTIAVSKLRELNVIDNILVCSFFVGYHFMSCITLVTFFFCSFSWLTCRYFFSFSKEQMLFDLSSIVKFVIP